MYQLAAAEVCIPDSGRVKQSEKTEMVYSAARDGEGKHSVEGQLAER